MHNAIRSLKAACDAASPPVTLTEAALRWVVHHSALGDGDAIIVGAKRVDQLQSNVEDISHGPLPAGLVAAVEGLWGQIKATQDA